MKPGVTGSARPTGTVTFLFSDIEGSTQRWDRDPAAMQDAVRRHDALMRAAIAAYDGYVFKTIGDAFCAAFWRSEEALAAILDAQRALAGADFSPIDGLRVRAAVHTGTADERDGDYFGPALNRVARLLTIGHGGQVLVSGVTSDLVQETLPPGASLRDLGEHRLRDLARPERVYQLIARELAADFPPLRSLDVLPNNLPRQLNTFVGREAEIEAITALLEKNPLVTLVGSGGVGKTRLALLVAANALDSSADGTWFVELAPLTSGDYIPSSIALALGITLPSEGDSLESLVHALKGKHALLIFDNCEHLLEPAARAISTILRGCSKAKVLASSRQALGVAGEAAYQVSPLDLPAKTATHLSATEALQFESVALFVDRARAASAAFSLTDESAPAVADICRRLDGIPLAIELAAARVKLLSPQQLRGWLDERFRLLTGGNRDVLPRQQALRALIDWSHDLLDERERTLFRRLGIFVDGFALEGAVAVGSGQDLDELDVFDLLASLVDKSLALAEPLAEVPRYQLLESTRAYTSEKLDDAGERDLIAGRHLRYLRDRFAERLEECERTARAAGLAAALKIDLEDVRSALDGALARGEVVDGGELLAGIYFVWQSIGLEAEGVTRCRAYLAAIPEVESRLRARLSIIVAIFLEACGDRAGSLELSTYAVEQARKNGDAPSLTHAFCIYASNLMLMDRLDDAEDALAQAEAVSDDSAILRITLLGHHAGLSYARGDLEAAARMFERLRKEHRSFGNIHSEQRSAAGLAEIEHARGRTQRAVSILHETHAAIRDGPYKTVPDAYKELLAMVLHNLAGYLVALDDLPGATAAARESIGIYAAREPDHPTVAVAIEHLDLVFALHGDLERAATLEAYADAKLQRHRNVREFTETTTHDRLAALLREACAPDELARLTEEGAALEPEAAVALALR